LWANDAPSNECSGGVLFVPDAARAIAAQWDHQVASATLSATELENFKRDHGYPIWALVSPRSNMRGVESVPWEPEGCGAAVVLFRRDLRTRAIALNPSVEAYLDFMAEVGTNGEMISEWHVPRSARLRGVRGSSLLVAAPLHHICTAPETSEPSQEAILAIGTDGDFEVSDIQAVTNSTEPRPCTVVTPLDPAFEAQCWEFTDQVSGTKRTVARVSVCH
jgi:hypothetical protein